MKAIILAAGQGIRLRPLTDDIPKCLVPFKGRPLVARSLDALVDIGVKEIVFVVGYKYEKIVAMFGNVYRDRKVTYVVAKDFATTNNIVSLWVAREAVDASTFMLLEGDLMYDPALLRDLFYNAARDVAVVDDWAPGMDGSVILAEGTEAKSLVLKKDQGANFNHSASKKTVNIYKFDRETAAVIFDAIGSWVKAGKTDQYYEAVFAELIANGKLRLSVQPIKPHRWAETDTIEDLQLAEKIFTES